MRRRPLRRHLTLIKAAHCHTASSDRLPERRLAGLPCGGELPIPTAGEVHSPRPRGHGLPSAGLPSRTRTVQTQQVPPRCLSRPVAVVPGCTPRGPKVRSRSRTGRVANLMTLAGPLVDREPGKTGRERSRSGSCRTRTPGPSRAPAARSAPAPSGWTATEGGAARRNPTRIALREATASNGASGLLADTSAIEWHVRAPPIGGDVGLWGACYGRNAHARSCDM